ncbi:MAG TPA: addiction module protein, partial [Pirellulales bacterium]|nr:addiction module protein [Pirellulales bacterium]
MALRDEIVKQALGLPPEDRAYLAEKLEESLPHDGFSTPEIAEAWASEIDRRLDAYDRGESGAVEFDEAL